jgi:hypothetical protein
VEYKQKQFQNFVFGICSLYKKFAVFVTLEHGRLFISLILANSIEKQLCVVFVVTQKLRTPSVG